MHLKTSNGNEAGTHAERAHDPQTAGFLHRDAVGPKQDSGTRFSQGMRPTAGTQGMSEGF